MKNDELRQKLYTRDAATCAMCGRDSDAIKAKYESERKRRSRESGPEAIEAFTIWRKSFLKLHGIPESREFGEWWDVDQKGKGERLRDFRTLCLTCKRVATAERRAQITAQERREKAAERDRTGLFADQIHE